MSSSLSVDLVGIESDAGALRPDKAVTRSRRFDVYLFWSFDLVGSSALKSKSFESFHWVDVIRDFYHQCAALLPQLGVSDAVIWKYIGDEILFYRRIADRNNIEHTVKAVFRVLDAYTTQLAASNKFADAAPHISIKAFAWMAPVMSYVDSPQPEAVFDEIARALPGDDQVIEESGRLDFLGPNIDAGFRLAQFARQKQLVLSAALARYLVESRVSENNLRIAGFSQLKGVAGGALYPGIWYRENWENIALDFGYEQRHSDALVKHMCEKQYVPLSVLGEVHERFEGMPYFFDRSLVDRIIALTGNRPERTRGKKARRAVHSPAHRHRIGTLRKTDGI
jgi:class 3 adenylate cyclase